MCGTRLLDEEPTNRTVFITVTSGSSLGSLMESTKWCSDWFQLFTFWITDFINIFIGWMSYFMTNAKEGIYRLYIKDCCYFDLWLIAEVHCYFTDVWGSETTDFIAGHRQDWFTELWSSDGLNKSLFYSRLCQVGNCTVCARIKFHISFMLYVLT